MNQIRVEPHVAPQTRGDAANERRPTGSGARYNPAEDRSRNAERRVDNGRDSTTKPEYRAPHQAAVNGPTPTERYRDNPGTTRRAETEIRPMMEGLGELPGGGPGPLEPVEFDPGRSRRPLGEIAPSRRGPATSQIQAIATAMTGMMQWASGGGNRMQLPTAAAAGMAQQQHGTTAPATAWSMIPHRVRARRSGMKGPPGRSRCGRSRAPTSGPPRTKARTRCGRSAARCWATTIAAPRSRRSWGAVPRPHHPPRPGQRGALTAAARGMAQTTQQTAAPAALPRTELQATHRAALTAAFTALRTGDTARQGPLAVGQNPAPARDGPVRRVADHIAAAIGSRSRGQRAAPVRHVDAVDSYRQDPRRADTATSAGLEPAPVPSVAVPAPINYQPSEFRNRGEMTENRPTVLTTGRGGPGTVGATSLTPALTASFRSDQR